MRSTWILLACLTSPLLAQEWTRFRGPNGQGMAAAPKLPTRLTNEHVRWRTPLPGNGHSSPVVWKDHVYLTLEGKAVGTRKIVCHDLASGTEVWHKDFRFEPHKQHRFNSFASSTPAVDAGGIYVLWTSGEDLVCLSLTHDGELRWRTRCGSYSAGHGSGSSPVVHGAVVLVANENEGPESALLGLDSSTGAIAWKLDRESRDRRGSFATPITVDRGDESFAVFVSTAHGVTAVDPKGGKLLWSHDVAFRQRFVATPSLAGDRLLTFAGSGGGGKECKLLRLASRSSEAPTVVASPRRNLPYVPCAVAVDQRFFLISDGGIASCLDAESGDVLWRERLDGSFFASPVTNGKTIYVPDREGRMHVFAAGASFEQHSTFDLGSPTYATPAIVQDTLVVRTRDELLRLGVEPAQDESVQERSAQESAAKEGAKDFPELTFHAPPSPRAKDAVDEDWPSFLGPRSNSKSRETSLLRKWPADGPKLVWEMRRGDGYASPVFAEGRMVYVHRTSNEMHIDCQDPESGKRYWRFTYPCTYRQLRYIRNAGQRSTPVIADGHVYVHGVGGMLHCLELASGKLIWKRNLAKDYEIGSNYFGNVSSPVVYGDLLIQNLGGEVGHTVAAFDRKTGDLVWGTGSKWGASCASPSLGKRHGEDRVFVLAGGMSRPPTGGLIVVDPANGKIDFEYPFRSRTFESVNGSPPVVGDDWVFISASYGVGSAILALDADGGFEQVWRTRSLGLQFQNALAHEGNIYCIEGNSRTGALVCIEGKTGEIRYRKELNWDEDVTIDGKARTVGMSVGEGSLLRVDGALLCLGDRGHLLRIEADENAAKVTDRAWLVRARESWTPPVVHRGLLYICQNKTEAFGASPNPPRLLCYDLRASQ